MSTNNYSSDQFPDSHLYCSYAHCLMESSSGHSNQKPNFFSAAGYSWTTGGGGGGSVAMFNLNDEDEEESGCDHEQVNINADDGEGSNLMGMDQFGQDEKEPLFEKSLTPSDVGKLNRLVIPKQHAERYFPISGGGGGGGDPGEKGFILSFEDEMGKLWRFRYSYWNSSQSYVLTKGWSRFVKEKRLDAGDYVLFSRHRADCDRLFIGWRKRNSGEGSAVAQLAGGRGDELNRAFHQRNPYPNQQQGFSSQAQQYQQDCLHAGSGSQNQTRGGGNSRRVRLFGVNLECQAEETDPSTPTDGSGHGSYAQSQNYSHSHHQDHKGWP